MQEQLSSLEHQTYKQYTFFKHVSEVLQTMTREQPADPLGSLEEMSTLLWKQRHVRPNPTPPSVPSEELDRCTSVMGLVEKLNSPSSSKVDAYFFESYHKFANAGITMSRDAQLMLRCSLNKLAEKEEIKLLRFWGIFSTPNGNLYVAEADIDLEHHGDDSFLPPVGPYDVPAEIGVGVNRFVYYVTKSPFDEWRRLPDCRPSDISLSRKITWQLTGDLEAAVHSFVPFEVTEEIYLRALISRITSATMLAPNGYIIEYQPEEEEEQNEPEQEGEEEEEKEPPPKQLRLVFDTEYEGCEVDSVEWVHVRPFILPQGRETYKKAPKKPKEPKPKKVRHESENGEEEEEEDHQEEEAAAEEEEEPEEPVELFGSIENDEGFGEEEPCWNTHVITMPVEGESIAIAESLRWPGAYNITDGKKAGSIYWGNGTKFVVNGFQPPAPPPMAKEYRRKMTEIIDPTVDEEKEVERLKNPPKEEEEEEDQNN